MTTTTLTVDQMNIGNIDSIIAGMTESELLNYCQLLIDERSKLPPNDRFFELKSMVEDHAGPLYQAKYQYIDVVALRAHYDAPNVGGYRPLAPVILAMVETALAKNGLTSNTVHTDGDFQAVLLSTGKPPVMMQGPNGLEIMNPQPDPVVAAPTPTPAHTTSTIKPPIKPLVPSHRLKR